jgi:predicted AlkP superfamily pyrophosphatase or phosphodiesterase
MIVVADHGMAPTSSSRRIILEDWLEQGSYHVVDLNPVALIAPSPGKEAEVLERLSRAPHLQVYRKDQIPARWHFRDHPRITSIVAVAEEGLIGTRDLVSRIPAYGDGGTHGYDNALPSMQAVFLAAGPAFGQGKEVARRNVDVYAPMAHILAPRAERRLR